MATSKKRRWIFDAWNCLKVFFAPLAVCSEVFKSGPGRRSRYPTMLILYVTAPPIPLYCIGVYKYCRDNKWCVEMIVPMKYALMTRTCFFVAYRNGNLSYLFGHVQFDYHRGRILSLLQTVFRKDKAVLGLYDVLRLVGHNPVLCLLALWCL